MKVLLTTIKNNESVSEKLALKYLYSVLVDAPIELSVKEFEPSTLTSDIYEHIVRGQNSVVYFHCDEYNDARIRAIIEMTKKALPSTVTVAGGKNLSFGTRAFMKENPCVDFVIRGEGESVLFNFIKTLVTYKFDFENIAGLAYRQDNDIYVNPLDAVMPMDAMPFPYDRINIEKDSIVYYESMRGAADRSTYRQILPDASVRALSLGRVCTELRYFLVKGVRQVVFTEKWFNFNPDRAYRIWEYIIVNDNGYTSFKFDICGDLIDDEAVRLLSTAREGLFEFDIDIESSNPETLAAVGRKENIYQMFYNINKLNQARTVKINAFMKLGLPLENEALFARSFNKIYGLEVDRVRVKTLQLLKGSELRKDAEKFGYRYNSNAPYEVIANTYLSAPEMIKIRSIAKIVDMYIAEGGFEESLPRIMTDTGRKPYDFFAELSDYIFTNGYDEKMYKQENLYRILYNFAIGLYDEMNDTLKLQILMQVVHSDLEKCMTPEAVKKFDRKGWSLDGNSFADGDVLD